MLCAHGFQIRNNIALAKVTGIAGQRQVSPPIPSPPSSHSCHLPLDSHPPLLHPLPTPLKGDRQIHKHKNTQIHTVLYRKIDIDDISKCYRRIWPKLGGHVGCVTRTNQLDFGEDPNPDPDTRIHYF